MGRRWRTAAILAAIGLGLLASAGGARGEEGGGCPDTVNRWVGEADRALESGAEAVACAEGRVRLRLRPRGAAPIDVEVSRRPGRAWRRVAGLAVSPLLDVREYDALPRPRRQAVADLVTWLGQRGPRLAMPEPGGRTPRFWLTPIGLPWAGPWLLLAGLAALVLGWGRPRATRTEVVEGLAVTGFALATRLALGIFGPLHVNGQGPLWVRAAASEPGLLSSYGPGYAEAFGIVASLGRGSPDLAVFVANAILSALVPLLLLRLGRRFGLGGAPLYLAAAVVAADPCAVRTGATEGYFTPITVLALTSALAFTKIWDRVERGRLLGAVSLGFGAALLAVAAARIHPAAWLPVALTPLAPLALPAPTVAERHRRRALALAAVAAVGLAAWMTSGDLISSLALGSVAGGPAAAAFRATLAAPPRLDLAILGSAAVVTFVATPNRPLAVLGLFAASLLVLTGRAYDQSDLWRACYERLFWPWPLLAVASALPRRPSWRGALWVGVPAAATVAGVLALHWGSVTSRTTEQLEYALLRRTFVDLPEGCRLAHLRRAGLRVVEIPDYASRATAFEVASAEDLAASSAPGACVYFVRSSLCAGAEAAGACAEIEASRRMEAILRETLPARPSHRDLPYARRPVEIAVLRASAPTGG